MLAATWIRKSWNHIAAYASPAATMGDLTDEQHIEALKLMSAVTLAASVPPFCDLDSLFLFQFLPFLGMRTEACQAATVPMIGATLRVFLEQLLQDGADSYEAKLHPTWRTSYPVDEHGDRLVTNDPVADAYTAAARTQVKYNEKALNLYFGATAEDDGVLLWKGGLRHYICRRSVIVNTFVRSWKRTLPNDVVFDYERMRARILDILKNTPPDIGYDEDPMMADAARDYEFWCNFVEERRKNKEPWCVGWFYRPVSHTPNQHNTEIRCIGLPYVQLDERGMLNTVWHQGDWMGDWIERCAPRG
jgi:hypothetical protein